MTNLFISYSSYDRPWAERLYNDLRRSFPTIQIFWDRDPGSLPPEADWSDELRDKARHTTHLAVLWSEHADASKEVGREIEAFDQNRETNPVQDGVKRKLFYIPLQSTNRPLEAKQGFTELSRLGIYSPAEEGRGVDKLNGAAQAEWWRLVRILGDTVLAAERTQPINLAVLAMNEGNRDLIDPYLSLRTGPGPTLQELLDAAGLTLAEAKKRYGANAHSWQPFGNGRTIIDMMEDLRVTANANLSAEYHFHWLPCDLVDTALQALDDTAFRKSLERLTEVPSAVVIDLIALFNPIVARVFARLDDYAKTEHSIIISLAPNEVPSADRLYQYLRSYGAPVLDGYFLPQVPSTGSFALCGVNVPYVMEVERLVRGSLGMYYLKRKRAEERPLVASGA